MNTENRERPHDVTNGPDGFNVLSGKRSQFTR